MKWAFESASETFEKYRERWDELNRSLENHLLLDSAFVGLLIRHFAPADILLGVSHDRSDLGMVLVERVRAGFWQTFQPSQAPLGLILLCSSVGAAGRVHSLMRCLPGYTLGFSVLQQDPDFTRFGEVDDGDIEYLPYITTSRLTVTGTFDQYWKTRSRNLVHNLARQRRRLADQRAEIELVVDRKLESVAEGIRIYGALESAGWKRREGTAITAENPQGLFYKDLLRHFCSQNEGVIYRLEMNGAPIASALCLERKGTLIVLKITYDESMTKYSPGLLLHEEMLRSLFAEKRVRIVEYYGRYSDWHQKWTDETREMYHMNFYRSSWVERTHRVFKAFRQCCSRLREGNFPEIAPES